MNRNNFPSANHNDLYSASTNRRRNDSLRLLWNNSTSSHTTHNIAVLYRALLLQQSTELHNFPRTMLPQHGSNMNAPITMRHDASLSTLVGNSNMNDAESAAALQSMLLSSSNRMGTPQPNSLPFLRQFEPMNQSSTTSAMLLQQQQQQQAELIARYQQQQQQQLRNQQQQQLQMLEPSTSTYNRFYGAAGQMGHPSNSYQEMMLLQQQQQQQLQLQQQLQQQGRGDDSLFNNNDFATLTGFGGGATSTSIARSQQQQQRLQQQSDLLQHQLAANNQQLQAQRIMMNDSLFPDPMEQFHQQQLQMEQQLRRRSSMSSGGASISPLLGASDPQQHHHHHHQITGVRPTLSLETALNNPNNSNQLFGGGIAGTLSDFTRFSNTAPMMQQPSLLSSLSNQQQFNNNMSNTIGNRPTSLLSSSALLHPDELAIIHNADAELARRDKKKRSRTFPEKLMAAMMEHEDERAVAWLPDGKSFVIVNPDLFVNEVLRGDFKQAKYASFVRKLHRWGFTRLTSGTGTDCFHHPQFNRNFPEWSSRVTCVPMKESAKEAPTIVNPSTSAAATKSRSVKHFAAKEADVTSDTAAVDRGIMDKPPSLAGVERFIRGKTLDAEPTLQFDTSSTVEKGNTVGTSKPTDATAGSRLKLIPIETTRDDRPEGAEGEQSGPGTTI